MINCVKKLILLLCFLAISYHLSAVSCYAQMTQYIRVAIIQDAGSFSLKISGFYELIDCVSKKTLYRGNDVKTTVTSYRDSILIAGKDLETSCLLIKTENTALFSIDGRMFKGGIRLIKKNNGHLLVVNQIALEDYVKGILYHEASHYWPEEALKAQAVVSRTYAVYQVLENKAKEYDVTSDIYSQVYGGKTSERYRTNKAVEDTDGLVVTYQGKIIPAYFHATCAGHTEDAALLWNIDIPPLKGVACDFCKDSPHFNWHAVLSLAEIRDKLADSGRRIKQISDISILGRDSSGRVSYLKIGNGKKDIKISAKDLRNIVGPNVIRSTNFKVDVSGDDVIFEGVGWGHGVGLCQWGAYFMAKQGRTYYEIIRYYYPYTDVKNY